MFISVMTGVRCTNAVSQIQWQRPGCAIYRSSVGPEVITLGDNNFQIVQFGWAILAAEVLPKTCVGRKFGARKAKGERATGYLGIELGRSF